MAKLKNKNNDKNIEKEQKELKELKKLVEELKNKFVQSEKEKQDYFAGWQREKADFINYKNKELERLKNVSEVVEQDLILSILPVLDNFNRAAKAINGEKQQDQNIKGLLMIKNQLEDVLKEKGIEPLQRLGKKFDPNLDEVLEAILSEEFEPDIVIEEIEAGYTKNGKLIRPAKVKISKR